MKRDSWIDHVARAVSLIGVSAPTFWLAFIMLAVFYGWLGWAPGPGQIGADQFPPPEVTGFMLIDAPLAGALGHVLGRAGAPGAALDRAGRRRPWG